MAILRVKEDDKAWDGVNLGYNTVVNGKTTENVDVITASIRVFPYLPGEGC